MTYQEGIRVLRQKNEAKFVLSGPETYLKEQFIKAAKAFNPDAEVTVFWPEDETESLSFFYSSNLFGGRIAILKDFGRMKTEKFVDVIRESQDIVIMELLGKGEITGKALTKIVSLVSKIECSKMREFGNDYPLWISSKVSDAGYQLETGADDEIYARVGPDMLKIATELNKLYMYKGEETLISVGDVKAAVSASAFSTSFDILENLLRRNVSGALRCLDSWSVGHEGFSELIAFLGNYLEKMYRMVLLRSKGMSPDDIASIIGLPKFIIKTKYLPKAQALGAPFIAECLNRVRDLDFKIRIFKGDKKLLLENFIFRFAL